MLTSINQQIVSWAKENCPVWQQNFIKRITRNETIDDNYIVSVAKAICDENIVLETPEFTDNDLPTGESIAEQTQFASIGKLKHINALCSDGKLEFGVSGLTVIYGDNGSGKSGYARLLKNIVGAHHEENVISNAYFPPTTD